MIYIIWSCRNQQEAKQVIHELLNLQLIACASIYPEVTSIYRWEGQVEESIESKVILKTQAQHFDAIQAYLLKHGSYEVPEIVQVEISQGNPSYLSWLIEQTPSPVKKS